MDCTNNYLAIPLSCLPIPIMGHKLGLFHSWISSSNQQEARPALLCHQSCQPNLLPSVFLVFPSSTEKDRAIQLSLVHKFASDSRNNDFNLCRGVHVLCCPELVCLKSSQRRYLGPRTICAGELPHHCSTAARHVLLCTQTISQ